MTNEKKQTLCAAGTVGSLWGMIAGQGQEVVVAACTIGAITFGVGTIKSLHRKTYLQKDSSLSSSSKQYVYFKK